jgi:acyl-CoA synthetase (AMP-forming)/AMP-acid ligase II/acyl carrier protein
MSSDADNSVRPLASASDLLARRARERRDQVAFAWLADGTTQEWTYGQLDARARAVAGALAAVARPGDRALLAFPPGLDFLAAFFGCLYAGVIPAPSTYPRPRRRSERMEAIAEDCRPTVALTTAVTLAAMPLADHSAAVQRLRWLSVEDCDAARAVEAPLARTPRDAAFLQYTSGSTSEPRGVVVSHGNLLHNLELIRCGFGLAEASAGVEQSGVFWLPAYHDMGLIGAILTPIYVGGTSRLMAPAAFLQRPLAWLEALAHWKADISGAPNFAYDLCVSKTTAEQRAGLDLGHWRLAFCGAEPIDAAALEAFAEAFAPAGFRSDAFYPCYGLAECTLMVSGGHGPGKLRVMQASRSALSGGRLTPASAGATDGLSLVACGSPLGDQDVRIVDPRTALPCGDGCVGEIWVRGGSVAQGYWDRPTAGGEDFDGHLADGAGPFLRTGDLGAMADGQLYVTGRLKDLIIVRGRNLYPQDVERAAREAHGAVDVGAAFSTIVNGREELALVHQIRREQRHTDGAEVLRAVRAAIVAEFDVDPAAIVLIKPASLPTTSSGKVQRSRCRDLFETGGLEVVAQSRHSAPEKPAPTASRPTFMNRLDEVASEELAEEIEAWMLSWIAERSTEDAGELSGEATFAELGMDSLTAVELNVEFERVLGLRLPPGAAWSYPTPAALSRYLADNLLGKVPAESEAAERISR